MTQPESLHVVHIIDELPPDGAERLLVDVLRNRSAVNRYTVVCLIRGGILADEIRDIGIPVVIIARRSKYDVTLLLRLRRWLVDERADVVHTHLFTADTWGRIAARLAGVRCVFSTVHSTNLWKSRLHRLIDWLLSRISTVVIACSHEVGEVLAARDHLPRDRLRVIANGIDLRRFSALPQVDIRQEFGIDASLPILAVIGRLHPAKGHEDLIPVLSRLASAGNGFVCLFIGEGELTQSLQKLVVDSGLERYVIFTGLRRDIPSLLGGIDIVVMPSRWEGLPMTLLEAMAMGRPVVASAVGGIPNVIENEVNGLLAAPGNADDLFRALERLIADTGLRERLGRVARENIIRRYDVSTTARAYEDLYAGCANAGLPQRHV